LPWELVALAPVLQGPIIITEFAQPVQHWTPIALLAALQDPVQVAPPLNMLLEPLVLAHALQQHIIMQEYALVIFTCNKIA